METLLKATLSRIDDVITKVSAEDPRIYDRIRIKAGKRVGDKHQVIFLLHIRSLYTSAIVIIDSVVTKAVI